MTRTRPTKQQICGWRHHPTRTTANGPLLVHVECPCGTISYGLTGCGLGLGMRAEYRRVVALLRLRRRWMPRGAKYPC